MWERTEITVGRIQCDNCGRPMEAMWEEKNGNTHATVYHCWHCDADREWTRDIDNDGKVTNSSVRRYFFG